MKTLLILLFPVFLLGQSPGITQPPAPKQPARDWLGKHDDVAHFYGSFFTNELAYQVIGKLFPEWKPAKKIFIASAFTLGVITLKERWDMVKANPTGWSWDDFFIGAWAIPIYMIVRVCLNDFRASDIYVDPFDPQLTSKKKSPKKWSLKRMGFLK